MTIKYSGEFPLIKRKGDIGYDLYCVEDEVVIKNHEIKVINSGIRIEFPDDYYADVRPKSGMTSQGIFTQLGLIDSSYRGEIGVSILNVTGCDLVIKYGNKIGQLVIRKESPTYLEKVDEQWIDTNTDRGEGGFGSTGDNFENNLKCNNKNNTI